jgi:hypothetical protein
VIPDRIECDFQAIRAANHDNRYVLAALTNIQLRLEDLERIVDLTRPDSEALINELRSHWKREWDLESKLRAVEYSIQFAESRGKTTVTINTIKYSLGLITADAYYAR